MNARATVIGACCHNSQPLFVDINFPDGISNVIMGEDKETLIIDFIKGQANAFEGKEYSDSLNKVLSKFNRKVLVVMGFHVNACVVATIGASRFNQVMRKNDPTLKIDDAVSLGYTVMTCPQILRGDEKNGLVPKDWIEHPNLMLYSQV